MPISTNLDRVRLLVGDTNSGAPILSDDEVNYLISTRTYLDADEVTTVVNVPAAAADAAAAIAAEYARDFDFAEDGQRFDRAQRVAHYLSLERTLRSRAGGMSVPVGGTLTT